MSNKQYFEEVATRWDKMRHSFFLDNVRDVALTAANVLPCKISGNPFS